MELSNLHPIRIPVFDDPAGGAAREMRADDQDRCIGEAGQHPLACLARRGRIGIGARRPVGPSDLAGMVHEVAGDQRLLAIRGDAQADMAWRVPWGRNKADFVADSVVSLDQIDESGVKHRGD